VFTVNITDLTGTSSSSSSDTTVVGVVVDDSDGRTDSDKISCSAAEILEAHPRLNCNYIYKMQIKYIKETPQCDETRFSTIQPSIYVTGIRNERWQWWKNYVVILVALVACTKFGVNRPKRTKVNERNLNFFFSNNDLDLDHRHLGSNPKLCLDVSYPYSKFGVNRPKQTKVIERKLNFYF